jgi:hypothetical protein
LIVAADLSLNTTNDGERFAWDQQMRMLFGFHREK